MSDFDGPGCRGHWRRQWHRSRHGRAARRTRTRGSPCWTATSQTSTRRRFAAVPCDVTSTAAVDAAVSEVAEARRHRHPREQRGDRRRRRRDGERRRRVASACSTSTSWASPASRERRMPHLRASATRRSSTPAPSSPPWASPSGPCTRRARARSRPSPWPWPPTTSATASESTRSLQGRRTPRGSNGSCEQAGDPAAAAEALRARQPMGRLVTADEVAYAIA